MTRKRERQYRLRHPGALDPTLYGLTPRQRQTFDYIRSYIARNRGIPPSQQDIADYIGVSRLRARDLVDALIERGWLVVLEYPPSGPRRERASVRRRSLMVAGATLSATEPPRDP